MRRSHLPPLLVAGLLVTGCTASSAAPADAGDIDAGDIDADVVVVATDLRFDPGSVEVEAGQPTTIHLANDGGIVHDLVLESGWESGAVSPGQATTVTLDPLTETTVAWCSVPGHRAAGMELELVVTEVG